LALRRAAARGLVECGTERSRRTRERQRVEIAGHERSARLGVKTGHVSAIHRA
jgi:hypothetical protein